MCAELYDDSLVSSYPPPFPPHPKRRFPVTDNPPDTLLRRRRKSASCRLCTKTLHEHRKLVVGGNCTISVTDSSPYFRLCTPLFSSFFRFFFALSLLFFHPFFLTHFFLLFFFAIPLPVIPTLPLKKVYNHLATEKKG